MDGLRMTNMWRAALVALVIVVAMSVRTALARSDSEARLLFDRATEAFNKGLAASGDERAAHIRTALAAYEALVNDKDIQNGALYFNIGNCHMHLDEIGEAILNYRRAERLTPGHRELQANLETALARRKDHIAPRERMFLGIPVSSIGRDVRAWLVRLPAGVPVLMTSFTLVWLVLGLKLVRRSAVLNALLVVVVIVCAVYAAAVALHAHDVRTADNGVVLDKEIIARTGPGEIHSASFEQPLHEGVEFRVLRREAGWIEAELPDGARCWLPAASVGTY